MIIFPFILYRQCKQPRKLTEAIQSVSTRALALNFPFPEVEQSFLPLLETFFHVLRSFTHFLAWCLFSFFLLNSCLTCFFYYNKMITTFLFSSIFTEDVLLLQTVDQEFNTVNIRREKSYESRIYARLGISTQTFPYHFPIRNSDGTFNSQIDNCA